MTAPIKIASGELPLNMDSAFVYLAYGHHGQILYVGVTNDIATRLTTHRRSRSRWIHEATRIVWEQYPDRRSAQRAEQRYIRELHPPYNTIHRVFLRDKPVEFPVESWVRLGAVVRARREGMRRSQRSLASDALVPAALWRGLEAGTPSSYPGEAIVAVERVLRWRPGSLEAVLAGGEPELLRVGEVQALALAAYDEVAAL